MPNKNDLAKPETGAVSFAAHGSESALNEIAAMTINVFFVRWRGMGSSNSERSIASYYTVSE
jgi:hypothetical protein